MRSMFHFWWQQVKQHRKAVVIGAIAFAIVIAFVIAVVLSNGTGFKGYTQVTTARTISGPNTGTVIRTEQVQPGKALWDWLQLLIIPVVLAVTALLFNLANTRTEQRIALDKQREDLLQKYLDCMSDLLLKEGLRTSAVDAEVRNFARVRTITLLFQLDARRIGYVFSFLRETKLMSSKPNSSIVSLSQADLRGINLSQADLREVDLSEANLSIVNLFRANLSEVDLSGADLSFADLSGADLFRANLGGADLKGANLSGANLDRANLFRANLSGADLKGASLIKTELSETDLSGASLVGAKVTEKQLKSAASLKGAFVPADLTLP
ncbi:MAG TPA: pentapeptide repeat-containing protein [Ktedonobacteraceae bacterium]